MRRSLIHLLTLLLAAAVSSSVRAQSLDAFKQQLARPNAEAQTPGGRVLVTEYGDAAQAVSRASQAGLRQRIRGYRVCIFFDNGQAAREGAMAAKSLFESTYPGVRVYAVYEAPYFKVSVGNCLTAEEAIILKGKVSGTFPKAFLKNEELSIADLLK